MLTGRWVFEPDPHQPPNVFRRHPYLVGVGTPGLQANGAFHNSLGFRVKENLGPKRPGIKRIVTLGGSTTYTTLIADGFTWPEKLQKELGDGYEVINMGMPGYTTVENLIETAFLISDLEPDIALYYEGWNDARVLHVKNLLGDYSNVHARSLYTYLGFGPSRKLEQSATVYFIKQVLFPSPYIDPLGQFYIEPDATAFTDTIDPRAIQLYQRNLRSIAAIARSLKIAPVFVPQVLNYEQLTGEGAYGWLPYVRDKDLKSVMSSYNRAMQDVASELRVPFVGAVLQEKFENQDFIDNGHFNQKGSAHFAQVLAQFIKETPIGVD
jgi:lysophospholipase L1-like esterase